MLINFAYADSHIVAAQGFLDKINQFILYPLITLMLAVALLVFLYGLFEYVKNSESVEARATGRRHIIWGIVGLLVMISALSILSIAAGTFGLKGELDAAKTDSDFSKTFPR